MSWNRQLSRSRSQSYKGFFFLYWKWLAALISQAKLRWCRLVTAWRIKTLCSHCHYCCLLTILVMLHIPSTHRDSAVLHGALQFQLGFPYELTREKPSYCLALQKKQEKARGAGEQDGELKKMIDTARKREHGKGRGKQIEWDKNKERRGRHRLNVRRWFHSS